MNPTPDHQTAIEVARLRAEFQGMSAGIERIAVTVERGMLDHESRLRRMEAVLQASTALTDAVTKLTAKVEAMVSEQDRVKGVISLFKWMGFGLVLSVLGFLLKR